MLAAGEKVLIIVHIKEDHKAAAKTLFNLDIKQSA